MSFAVRPLFGMSAILRSIIICLGIASVFFLIKFTRMRFLVLSMRASLFVRMGFLIHLDQRPFQFALASFVCGKLSAACISHLNIRLIETPSFCTACYGRSCRTKCHGRGEQ